jgi:hypothetical protein
LSGSWWDTAPERHLLGDSYKLFASVLGWERAIDIGFRIWQEKRPPSKLGGVSDHGSEGVIYVPKRISETKPPEIVRFGGEADSHKLSAALGGEVFTFPSLEMVFRGHRNRAIVKQVASGLRMDIVAASFGISERQARRVCAKVLGRSP